MLMWKLIWPRYAVANEVRPIYLFQIRENPDQLTSFLPERFWNIEANRCVWWSTRVASVSHSCWVSQSINSHCSILLTTIIRLGQVGHSLRGQAACRSMYISLTFICHPHENLAVNSSCLKWSLTAEIFWSGPPKKRCFMVWVTR